MAISLCFDEAMAPDQIAERNDELRQESRRICFGMGLDNPDKVPCYTMESRLSE